MFALGQPDEILDFLRLEGFGKYGLAPACSTSAARSPGYPDCSSHRYSPVLYGFEMLDQISHRNPAG
jgi:hypothetical protein